MQPISHDTRAGGCAVEIADVEGEDAGPHRFCLGRPGKPCLWVHESASALRKAWAIDDAGAMRDLSGAYAQALRLLRPSFGPTPALPPAPESPAMEKVKGWSDEQRRWEAYMDELAALGLGESDSTAGKKAAEKKASIPHSDAPFIGGSFVFQGVCREVSQADAPPAAAEGFETSYEWLHDLLETRHPQFYGEVVRAGGAQADLPFCSPTSPDLGQVKRTVQSFSRSPHHYARACKAGAGTEGRDESATAAGHACVIANGEDNPDPSVREAYAPRLPTKVAATDPDAAEEEGP